VHQVNPVLGHQVRGNGPDVVVLLHGVGVGAPAFDRLAEELAATHTVVVADRRGYGTSRHLDPAVGLDTQIDDLRQLLDTLLTERGNPPAVIGVSGGATLTLALAIRHARAGTLDRLGPLVVHEPLVGPLAPRLAALVDDGYRRTIATTPGLSTRYVTELVGPATWAALDETTRRTVEQRREEIALEVPHFLAFAPTRADLSLLRSHHLVASLGATSPPARADATDVLVDAAGARRLLVPGAGHLPHVDAPSTFAALLRPALSPSSNQVLT
jgi:pimeloyl-ACP methyl ester carboxylesterase